MSSLTEIEKIPHEYGFYARIVDGRADTSTMAMSKYIVVSVDPIEPDVDAERIYRRIERDDEIFYPLQFAFPVNSENCYVAVNQVIEYCRDAEFLMNLYMEYDATLPFSIRYSEMVGLKNWVIGKDNEAMPFSFRADCEKGLKIFFKNEKTRSRSGQEKRRFFRSNRYDENASMLQRRADYANRDSPIVRLPVLLQSANEICKKKIASFDLEPFCDYIKEIYPDINFALSDKEIIDLGLLDLARRQPDHPAFAEQRPVTNETFRKTIRSRFASEGFACTNDIQPVYWEYYDIYYRKEDEPRIITAFNDIFLRFAKHNSYQDVAFRGPVGVVTIAMDNFHSFVAHCKSSNIKFHIDLSGDLSKRSFNEIHVVYSKRDEDKVHEIMNFILNDKALNAHIKIGMGSPTRFADIDSLQGKIKNAEKLLPSSKPNRNDKNEREI